MSPDKENEYFSDGLTEDIIDALTKLAGLRVVARGSSFAFRGRENAVREIAEKLKVETVLHGSVRRAGSRIRVTAQLISIADESQLWSERYDRELTDIFAIQDEIAHAIVDTLEVKLIQPIRRKGFDLHAHSLYQKGIFHFPRWSGGNIYTAIRYLEEAVKTDRSHAPAWLALADCHLGLAVSSLAHPRKEVPAALECAREAVAADDRFEDAQVQLRYLEAISLLKWRASLERSEQALRENPDSHRALVCHSGVLMAAGESGRAIADLQRIIELDPLSPLSLCILARAYAMEGRFDRTAEYSQAAIDLYAHHWALASLGSAYVHLGRIQEGIGLLERARTIDPGDSASGLLCDGYACSGHAEQAIAIFEMLVAKRNSQYISASTLTECAAAVGDMDGAFRWLNVAIEERDPQLLYLPAAGSFPAIRADQRYREVRRKMSLDSIDRQ